MRIISGKFRSKVIVPPSNFKARPTTDMAKESLFNVVSNMMGDDVEQLRVLDLFGGTGSISYEFASRGCKNITTIELNYNHYAFIKKTVADLKIADCVQVIRGDAFKFIDRCTQQFDIVFADPPYDLPRLPEVPQAVIDHNLVAPGGIMIMEHSAANDFSQLPQFVNHKHYGSVNFSFFQF